MEEKLSGIVERITFHNADNGWTVLKVKVFNEREPVTVIVHQMQAFPGATIDFYGNWTTHPKFGRQFKAARAIEQKPATIGALEKYIGSGLIYGVGPAIAQRIVRYFGKDTLSVFENEIDRLKEINGISARKLAKIKETWEEHRAIRDVMIFLQEFDISTLFAVRIFKQYGNDSIRIIQKNPYQLARDIYGIGFHSADKIALKMGMARDGEERIKAAILHSLSNARESGHCYLTDEQVIAETKNLLGTDYRDRVMEFLVSLERENHLRTRIKIEEHLKETCYYNKALWYDEELVRLKLEGFLKMNSPGALLGLENRLEDLEKWEAFPLSPEQKLAVVGIVNQPISILTGGPGCGKTTTTRMLVRLLKDLNRKILLAAPTGRAAQRMSEVIGMEAKTIHRMLVFNPQNGEFKFNEEHPLPADFLIVDECSMLDITLTNSLLRAVASSTQVLFIGDADQLPSVGAGNVLRDLIDSGRIPVFRLQTIFRQASESQIIRFAHQINNGIVPQIETPFRKPEIWKDGTNCLFIDAEEATQEQLRFIARSKGVLKKAIELKQKTVLINEKKKGEKSYLELSTNEDQLNTRKLEEEEAEYLQQNEDAFYVSIPAKFQHVNPEQLLNSPGQVEELSAVLKQIHPQSVLHYGFSASTMLLKLYKEIIPRYLGDKAEIQVLAPMTRGTLGTYQLNRSLQQHINPPAHGKSEVQIGDRLFRVGDRVIQRRNNYDLEVFNGDIGTIIHADNASFQLTIRFGKAPDTREVTYEKSSLNELDLAYAITIHKSQGSEFDAVILPIAPQHFNMLYRNLVYTGLTRAKKMAVFIGARTSLARAVKNQDNRKRQTMLCELLKEGVKD